MNTLASPQGSRLLQLIRLARSRASRGKRSGILAVERFFASSPFLASCYYFFFCPRMRRECQATLTGKVRHLENIRIRSNAGFLLRRNIHRLEKGLIMKPRKPVFGLAYIEETVLAFEICMENQGERPLSQELLWARDVLQEFFSKVDSQGNPLLRQCKDRYESALKGVQDHCQPSTAQQATRKIPYRRDLSSRPVTPDAFRALCIKRRSVRWFLDKPVPRQRVDEAILSGTLSPSACNRQPFSFRIFDDPEKVQAVASIPMGTKGFCQNFSMIAVVVGELSAYSHERDRHVIYVDAALATMGFTLALETEGLSSCVINWPDIEEKEQAMQRALSLRTDERVIMLVAIGWPDPEECVPYSQKKELECIRSYN